MKRISRERTRELPCYGAVYLVIWQDQIVYIGGTMNLRQRWVVHPLRYLKEITGFEVTWFRIDDWRIRESVETFLIRHFRPRLNRLIPKAIPTTRPEFTQIPQGWITLSVAASLTGAQDYRLRERLRRLETANQWGYLVNGRSRRRIVLDPALLRTIGDSK